MNIYICKTAACHCLVCRQGRGSGRPQCRLRHYFTLLVRGAGEQPERRARGATDTGRHFDHAARSAAKHHQVHCIPRHCLVSSDIITSITVITAVTFAFVMIVYD